MPSQSCISLESPPPSPSVNRTPFSPAKSVMAITDNRFFQQSSGRLITPSSRRSPTSARMQHPDTIRRPRFEVAAFSGIFVASLSPWSPPTGQSAGVTSLRVRCTIRRLDYFRNGSGREGEPTACLWTMAIVPFLTSDPHWRYRIVDDPFPGDCQNRDTIQATKTVPQITASAIVSHIKLILSQ